MMTGKKSEPTTRGAPAFPPGFLWGAATSAYQIEGSPLADGAGPSNWHVFSHAAGNTHAGQTGDLACDHYRRWRDDVALMRELGLTAYRFSIAWSRVLPEGRGRVNQAGLDFYARLVDALLAAGIQPCVTLYHWDLPAALDETGGWLASDIAGWFADYARLVVHALGDRVPLWVTINEPWVVMDAGYVHGVHAPGRCDPASAPLVAHNLLRAHGAAVQACRAETRQKLGIVLNIEPKDPATGAPADLDAAARSDAYMNRWFLEALQRGRYPEELRAMFAKGWRDWPDPDMTLIREPLDFLGVNYYTRGLMRHADAALPARADYVRRPRWLPASTPFTDLDWEVHPDGLTRALLWVKERCSLPLYITENGAAFPDPDTGPDGGLIDRQRVDYLGRHLLAAREALHRGVDLRGYFVWSLLDNYEWACGFTKRFGIVHVDFGTQRRTLKASGRFYRDVLASNGGELTAWE